MRWHEKLNLVLSFTGGICLPLYIVVFVQPNIDRIKEQQAIVINNERERKRIGNLRVETDSAIVDENTRKLFVSIFNYGLENSDTLSISIKPVRGGKLPPAEQVFEEQGAPFEKRSLPDGSMSMSFAQGIGAGNVISLTVPDIKIPEGYMGSAAAFITVFSKGSVIYPPPMRSSGGSF